MSKLGQQSVIKTTAARLFVTIGLVCVGTAGTPPASAEQATQAQPQQGAVQLTEEQAVRRALDEAATTALWGSEVDLARAEALTAGAWPNPSIEYTREQIFEDPDTVAEDELVLEQSFPISGRRGLLADAARASVRATQGHNGVEARQLATKVRQSFYRVVATRDRIEIRTAWIQRMRQLEATIQQRVEAGESAPYDLERIRRETADVVAAVSVDEAEQARSRARLASLLGMHDVRVAGEILPGEIPDDAQLQASIELRPELVAAQARMEAAELRVRAASRWWIPEPTIVAGYKGASTAGERFHGFVAGIGLMLPIFDRQQGERAAADAQLVQEQSRRELVARRLKAELSGAAARARTLQAAVSTYRTEGVERAQNLLQMARGAYDGGEVGIIELIDAYRGLVDSQLRLLELAAEARASQIELQQDLDALEDSE